jgi:hypothetical protein
MRRGVSVLVVVAVLLLSGTAMASPPKGLVTETDRPFAGPVPELSISLTPSQLQAEVSQSQLGAVTFGGEVTVDQMRLMSSTVTLTSVVNTGWPVVLSPQTIEFTGPGTENFQVTVIVPPSTSALLTGNVIVTGQCKAPGLAPVTSAASAVVTVSPYYLARIGVSDGNIMVDAGEEQEIDLTVHNDANMDAQMRIYVLNKPKEVRVSFSETEFAVQQDENVTITLTVSAIGDASPGDYQMDLVVETDSRDGAQVIVANYSMSVYIPSFKAKLGFSGMVIIISVVVVCVGLAVLWRTGRFQKLKDLKFLRRSTS